MKSARTIMTIIILILLTACSTSTQNTNKDVQTAEPEWVIHVPRPWVLYKKGKKKNIISFMLYKRKAIQTGANRHISPVCIITNEYVSTTQNLKSIALSKQTTIITSMAKRGYSLKSHRKDIITDINAFIDIDESIGLAYDFTSDRNTQSYLAISVYAKRNGHLLHINFETLSAAYPFIRNEIKTIITSIQ